MYKITDEAINLIKSWEGLFLTAYQGKADKPGIHTIGYGTIQYPPHYLRGKRVKLGDPAITEAQAFEFLKYEVLKKADAIDVLLRDDLTANQFGALLSFSYNVGEGALKMSKLRAKVNKDPNDPAIRAEFMRWKFANGVQVKGLANRRKSEADLYFKK